YRGPPSSHHGLVRPALDHTDLTNFVIRQALSVAKTTSMKYAASRYRFRGALGCGTMFWAGPSTLPDWVSRLGTRCAPQHANANASTKSSCFADSAPKLS